MFFDLLDTETFLAIMLNKAPDQVFGNSGDFEAGGGCLFDRNGSFRCCVVGYLGVG